jgi:hypothetical protein
MQIILKAAGYIKLSWFIPDFTIGSLLYYCFVVYPMLYILGYRMFISPFWDIFCGLLGFARYIASLYDRYGVTPESFPRDAKYEGTLKSGLFGVFTHVLNQTAFILSQKL